MTPLRLKTAFIGLQIALSEYEKVEGLLPIPSYKNDLQSNNTETYTQIIYEIKHILHTPQQYQWLNDIKVNWSRNLIINFDFIDEVYINEHTICNGATYQLQELSRVFKNEFVKYPKPYYPQSKKELHKRLVWFAMRTNKKELLYKEILYATALKMNSHLKDRYSQRELFNKVISVLKYVRENQIIKSKDEVMKIKKENGRKRGEQISKEHQARVQRVKELIPLHVKPNGRPNITAISKEMKIRRETISRIVKTLSIILFIFWIKSSLIFVSKDRQYLQCTILPGATVTLFTKYHKKGVSRGC